MVNYKHHTSEPMPQTTPVSNASLGIRLEQSQSQYAPGEAILGCVFRKRPLISSEAFVTISLQGRTKCKLLVPEGNNGSSSCRARVNLLSEAKNTQRLFEGPIHIPTGGDEQTWPFIITIPTHVDDLSLGTVFEDRNATYLPLEPEHVATHELPPTFSLEKFGGQRNLEAFVEYFIKAELYTNTPASVETKEASLPLTIRNLSSDPPIADFRLRKAKESHSISAYRLVPGMQEKQLSLSQKTRQFFNSAKVPTLWFNLQVSTPTVIQLENPNYIPFIVSGAPEWNKTSKGIQGVQLKAKLKSITIKIAAKTAVKCDGGFYYTCHDSIEEKVDLKIAEMIIDRDIFIPISDDVAPINIGKLTNLRIGYDGRVDSDYSQGSIAPDFETYNIQHTHRLKWRLVVEMAGEQSEFSRSHPITILRPSDDSMGLSMAQMDMALGESSWMKPPDEEVEPPSFEQAQRDV